MAPNDHRLLADLSCASSTTGFAEVDGTGWTTVPGVLAVGNAVDPRAQVITAAGEGSAAAIAINADLVGEDVGLAVDAVRWLEQGAGDGGYSSPDGLTAR